MIKCPNCEGEMSFEPGVQEVVCQYCGSKFNPNTVIDDLKKSKVVDTTAENNGTPGKAFMCTQCGARLLTFDETAITFCSYCGSQAMVEDKMIQFNKPDFIIPFKITKEECIKKYTDLVSHNMFLPNYLKDDVYVDKFRGIYMPYSIYDFSYSGPCSSKGSKYDHHSMDYDYYNDYEVSCNVEASFGGVAKDLRSNFYDKFSDNLVFDLKSKEDYNPNYLVGYYADVADVDPKIYVDNAMEEAQQELKSMFTNKSTFSRYGAPIPDVPLNPKQIKTGMFPFYFLAIKDKKLDRMYYAVVNGQTGEMYIDLPVSKKKYIFGSLIVSLIIYAFIFGLSLFNVRDLFIPLIILSVISIFVLGTQANKINKMFFHEDDEGYSSINMSEKKNNVNIFKYIYKNVLAFIILLVVYLMNFFQDGINYGAVIVSLILIILSFGDLMNIHNLLVSNKLPQMNKRGGDESE